MKIGMISALLFMTIANMNLYSQNVPDIGLDSLARNFMQSLRSDTREMIFVQTSKQYYIAGEDLWFKAYCLNAFSHKISTRSKIVFADLVNDQDSVISQLLLNNRSSGRRLEGKISLSVSLAEGYYWLRIYTGNILQEDSSRICVHPVYLFNPRTQSSALIPKGQTAISNNSAGQAGLEITFYPEGGTIVSGTNTVVAVKVRDKKGVALEVSGYITDSRDSVVAKFETNRLGLGKFSFLASDAESYSAHISGKNGLVSNCPLPLPNPLAGKLSVLDQDGDSIRCLVSLGDSIYRKGKRSYVLAISRDKLCFGVAGRDNYRFYIPKRNLPQGKTSILLFDDQLQIIGERDVYISQKKITIQVTSDKDKYGPREKVNLAFSTNQLPGRSLLSLISISVTDDHLKREIVDGPDINNLVNNNIELPETGNEKYSEGEWDLIMLSQKNGLEPWKSKISPSISSRSQNKMDSGAGNMFPSFPTPGWLKKRYSDPDEKVLAGFKNDHLDTTNAGTGKGWLKPVIIRSVKKKEVSYDETKRVSQFSKVIPGDRISQGANGFQNALLSIPGVGIRNGYISILGGDFDVSRTSEPLLVIDGNEIDLSHQIPDISCPSPLLSYLGSLSPTEIDFVEVLVGAEAAAYGLQGGHGVILVNTKSRLKEEKSIPKPDSQLADLPGFFVAPFFDEPDYDIKEIKESPYPDLRSTIYWNGNILTDSLGNTTIHFFTADDPATYTVTFRGITSNGTIIAGEMKVERR